MKKALRKELIKLAHDQPELREHLLPLLKEAAPQGSKTVYKKVDLKDGVDGKGNKIYAIQAEAHHPSGKVEYINEKFTSKAEAKNWVKHSMPGAKLAAAEGPFTGKGWSEQSAWLQQAKNARPTPVTASRAKQIIQQARKLAKHGPWSDQLTRVMTQGEYRYVSDVWDAKPGSTSFVDALTDIAKGRVASQRGSAYKLLLEADWDLKKAIGDLDYQLYELGEKNPLAQKAHRDLSKIQKDLQAIIKDVRKLS